MDEGPELGADPPPSPEPPPPGDAARIIEAISRARNAIVGTVVAATLLILAALLFMRCTDPYRRCERLVEKEAGPTGLSEEELETWDELGCGRWPAY